MMRIRAPQLLFAAFAKLAAFGALVVAVPGLGAQERLVDGVGDAAARAAIRATVQQLETRGVPTAPLLTKVREGMAKQAPPARIADAVAQLGGRLTVAHAALAVATSSDEVAAGAGALQAGVGEGALRELRRRWTTAPLTVPLGVMTQMVASGVPVARAVAQVRILLERGATPSQLVAFTSAVQSDVAAGIAPDVAMVLRADAVAATGATTVSSPLGSPPRPPPLRPSP